MTAEQGCLTLICRACTRQQRVFGPDQEACEEAAFDHGWRDDGKGRMVCPACPAVRERQKAA